MAEVVVDQRFKNDTCEPIEAVYLFPLPHEASVFKMSFRIGERTVTAVVKEKEEAKRAYAQARHEGRAATLLEQDTPSVFTLSVANVPPGQTIEVTLGYQERVAFDDGEWRFVFPMVAEDRWEGDSGARGAPLQPPRPRTDSRRSDVSVEVVVRGAEPARSPSHRVTVAPEGEGFRMILAESGSMPNRDFVLAWGTRERGVRPAVWFQRERGRPGTFLLVVTPPAPAPPDAPREAVFGGNPGEGRPVQCGNCGGTVRAMGEIQEVPGIGPSWRCTWCGVVSAVSREAPEITVGLPRDVVFLVDRSASMREASVAQARRAVRLVLEHLAVDDAVQVVAFDHERIVLDEAALYLPVGTDTTSRVDAFLAGLTARGGSELEAALERGAALPVRKGRAKLVVLLTDAAVGDEGRLLRRTREILDGTALAAPKQVALVSAKTRLFVLGIGPSVHRWLIARLARVGGGASDVLLPTEDVETVVTRFARRVRHGGPVLRGLRLAWDDALPADVYPSPIPELFGGQPVEVVGRFAGDGPTRLVLTGETAAGAPFRQEIDVTLPEASTAVPGLERVWARARIEARLDRLIEDPSVAADVRLEVLGLALKHSLVSPYTSLVAEDSEKSVDGPPRRVEMRASSSAVLEDAADLAEADGSAAHGKGAAADTFSDSEPITAATRAVPSRPVARAAAPAAERGGVGAFGAGPPMAGGGTPYPVSPAPSPTLTASAPPATRMSTSHYARPMAPPTSPLPPRGYGPPAQAEARPQAPPPMAAKDTESYSNDELAWARGRPVGDLDLVFLVDETGSMGAFIHEVQQHLLAIIDALRAAPLCKNLRLGLVSYRDHPPQDQSFVSRVVPLTDDVAAVRTGVERMQAQGGGDGPESVTDGLYDLVRLDWRPRAARVVVWVGDAPPHGVEPSGDGFPQGCPCGHHWYTQAESCREMGIVIHAVGCLPALRNYVGAEAVFKTVARTARGLYLPLQNAPLLVPLITGVAETELDKQRIEERIADVLATYEPVLRPADDQERLRFVTDVLRQANVRPRGVAYDPTRHGPPPLRFREITRADVEEGVDRLRRLGRTTL